MLHFGLDWEAVALRGTTGRWRRFVSSHRGEDAFLVGDRIRRGRRLLGLSLRGLASGCGLSAAQLSRIERGEVQAGRGLSWPLSQDALPMGDRSVLLADALLRLVERFGAGDMEPHTGSGSP
jgi:hypothetical protein